MKEATGELNMTVITIVAIAAIAAFFYAFIWPSIQANMRLTSACNAAGGTGYTEDDITCALETTTGKMTCSIENGASKVCN